MRIWIVNPPAMVNMYFPTAENKPIPDVATVLVISPKTPSGAKRIMILVIFIITSKDAEKKFRKTSDLGPVRVSPTPRKMAKKIIPSISPDAVAWKGFKGIISIKVSDIECASGILKFSPFNPKSIPIPG